MRREWIIAIAALGCIAPLTTHAQEPTAVASVAGQASSTGPRRVMGTVMARITVDRPYTAEAVNESLQMLPDGNKIHRTSITRVYRDSAGRTRREILNDDGTVRTVTISDPVSKVSYTMDPATKTATKGGAAVAAMETGGSPAASRRALITAPAAGEGGGRSGATTGVATVTRDSSGAGTSSRSTPSREALDPQVLEGLHATGTRITTTIPAGQVGNAQELKIISEQWIADELQLLVMTRHSDPRSGESIYRLRNIVRGEPDASLFTVPSDYTVVEGR